MKKRSIRLCGLTTNYDASEPDYCERLYCLVRGVDASGVVSQPTAWMSITFAVDLKAELKIRLISPPFVSHVICGFTLTLPPLDLKAGC